MRCLRGSRAWVLAVAGLLPVACGGSGVKPDGGGGTGGGTDGGGGAGGSADAGPTVGTLRVTWTLNGAPAVSACQAVGSGVIVELTLSLAGAALISDQVMCGAGTWTVMLAAAGGYTLAARLNRSGVILGQSAQPVTLTRGQETTVALDFTVSVLPDGGADASDGGNPDAPPAPRLIGTPCTADAQCAGTDATCLLGICTRTCGSGGAVANCNDARVANRSLGSYACWSLGPSRLALCWPNGSGTSCAGGAACPRADEACLSDVCQYPRAGGTGARTDLRCHRDADCKANEGCALIGNLDDDNVRAEGACLWRGEGTSQRQPGGTACDRPDVCASFDCRPDGTCATLCAASADCATGMICGATALRTSPLAEFPSQWVGLCETWPGSRAACAGTAACAAGEACVPHDDFTGNDTIVAPAGACRAAANPTGAATGAACAADADCQSGSCVRSAVTGTGYCTAYCLGGAADCAGGTSCRQILWDARDPAITTDDARVGKCVRTGLGSPCFATPACRTCVNDDDCNAAQSVHCLKAQPGDATGVCRDRLGRCLNPCRHDCTPGAPGPCPAGSTCTTDVASGAGYCAFLDGTCAAADLPRTLQVEHGMCGDDLAASPQQDLCYFYGQSAGQSTFACGQACTAGGAACPDITTATGTTPTTCRTVYEYGATTGSVPTQCAPAAAFTP